MTFPIDLPIGNTRISLHLLFEITAFAVGFNYLNKLRQGKGDTISESNRIWILIAAALGAFIFSRLLGTLEDPGAFSRSQNGLLFFFSSKTIVGALLGGLMSVELCKIFLKEKRSSGDLLVYPLILAMIIGRIGCFTSGIHEPTFGVASSLPWAMDLGDSIPRHPLPLYEIFFLGVLWLLLKIVEYSLNEGVLFRLFLFFYLLYRFLIEFIKPSIPVVAGFSVIQLACFAGMIYYLIIFIIERFSKASTNGE